MPPGFCKLEYPDGRKRVGRLECAIEDRCVRPCFRLEDVMEWFNPWSAVTSVGMGESISRESDETGHRVALRHGRTKWQWFNFCPFCGKNIEVKLRPKNAAATQPALDASAAPTTTEIHDAP